MILVSAGFDAAAGDLLGDMHVTPDGYAAMTQLLQKVANRLCKGRLMLALEGMHCIQSEYY